jgi:hypothetical protein
MEDVMKLRVLVAAPVLIAATAALVLAGISAPASGAIVRTAQTPTCHTNQLRVGLKLSGHAAGTTYYAIVFSRRGTAQCALRGYPGVSFVAPATGHQVGAAASRNARKPVRTVLVGNGRAASALLGMAHTSFFDAAACQSRPVSGLRVYPPGGSTAVYLPFRVPTRACSTAVKQLSIAPVVPGTTAL